MIKENYKIMLFSVTFNSESDTTQLQTSYKGNQGSVTLTKEQIDQWKGTEHSESKIRIS